MSLASECKQLLPSNYIFPEINSLQNCHEAVTKATLHYIHTCQANTEHPCNITMTNTENPDFSDQHSYKNIYQHFFKESLLIYSAPPSSSSNTSAEFSPKILPIFDFSIFEKEGSCTATFSVLFPT